MLKIRTCPSPVKLARSCKQLCLLCLPNPRNLPDTAFLSRFQRGSFHWVRQYLVNLVLFGIRDLVTSEMTIKLKSSLYIRPVNIFPVFYPTPVLSLGIVVACVCVCVCLSVCLSVCQSLACPQDNSGPVQVGITKFGLKMQKTLVMVPIVLWTDRPWPSRSNLTWNPNLPHFELVRTITHHPFKLGSPNLDQRCIIPWLRSW